MSGYFARLVQRASGAEQRNHATPAVRAAQASSDTHDPFEATAPVGPPPQSSVPFGSREAPKEIPASHTRSELHRVPVQRASPQAQSSIEPRRESGPVAPQPTLAPKTYPPDHDRVPQAKDFASKERKVPQLVERAVVEREITHEILQPAPNATVPDVQPISPVEPGKPRFEPALTQPEKPAAAPFPPLGIPVLAAPELRAPLEPLKPQKQAIPAPAVALPEEPRLVIGRMQIDVIPAAPAAPPPRVSASPGRRAAPTEGAALSRLQFGLAQM